MKTSNKLLVGMYFFIIVLILSSYVVIKSKSSTEIKEYKETYFITDIIDSLEIYNAKYAIIKSGNHTKIKYNLNSKPDFKLHAGKLTIQGAKYNFIIEVANAVKYIELNKGQYKLDSFSQDYLKIKSTEIIRTKLSNSVIDTLDVKMKSSNIIINNSKVNNVKVNLSEVSRIDSRSFNEVLNIVGEIDSTSKIFFNKVNNISLKVNKGKLYIQD